jgi:hypothetical protein
MARTLVGEDTLGAFVVASEFLFPVILVRSIWLVGKLHTDMPVIPKTPAASSPIDSRKYSELGVQDDENRGTKYIRRGSKPVRRHDRYPIRRSVIRRSRAVAIRPEQSHIDRVYIQGLGLELKP